MGCESGRAGGVGRDTVFLVAPGNTGFTTTGWIVAGRAVSRWFVVIGVGDWQAGAAPDRALHERRDLRSGRARRPGEQILGRHRPSLTRAGLKA